MRVNPILSCLSRAAEIIDPYSFPREPLSTGYRAENQAALDLRSVLTGDPPTAVGRCFSAAKLWRLMLTSEVRELVLSHQGTATLADPVGYLAALTYRYTPQHSHGTSIQFARPITDPVYPYYQPFSFTFWRSGETYIVTELGGTRTEVAAASETESTPIHIARLGDYPFRVTNGLQNGTLTLATPPSKTFADIAEVLGERGEALVDYVLEDYPDQGVRRSLASAARYHPAQCERIAAAAFALFLYGIQE